MKARELAFLLFWLVSGTVSALAQNGTTKEDEDVLKAGPKDPFTEGDPAVMAAAGVVAYGPFPWADYKTTDDIDEVLGKGRILWMETAHFRIGFNLKTIAWPEDQKKRKYLQEEFKRLHKRLPKMPEKPRKLEPWVRLHLYAQRLEELYADFQEMLGVTDADFGKGKQPPDGPYLGMPDKYLVLLFQKRSDLARYFERFCSFKADSTMRWYHQQTNQVLAAVAVDALEGFDATALHGHVTYAVAHNLLSGYRSFHLALPMWFDEGIAHHFALKVPSDVVNVQILDSEADPEAKINAWPVKVRKRAQHDGVCYPFETMAAWTKFEEMGYHAHSQAWSRVDYLLQLDREKVALMIQKLKSMPPAIGGPVPPAEVSVMLQKLLIELFELDAKTFDERWREWVLKTYPKK